MAKRKNEKFKRIKASTLAKLLSEQEFEESIYNLNRDDVSDFELFCKLLRNFTFLKRSF